MEERKFKVLEESVSEKDEFDDKTHELIANKIYDVLAMNSSKGLTIGLEGSWGSGKSTIVSIIKQKVINNPEIGYFYFDAWSHEGDPLRRVFLESIVSQLDPGNKKLEELTNRISNRVKNSTITSKQNATTLGKILAIASIFVPLGLALTNATTRNYDFFININSEIYWPLVISLLVTLFPGVVLFCNLITLFIKKYFLKKIIRIFKSENWMFLQTESTQTVRQEISDDEERSSIEFERYFDDIIKNIFTTNSLKKILVVIDNLDRVNPEDTLKIWSTLQTFLQERNPSGNRRQHYDKIWILVPYDPEGMKKVWDNNEHNGAQSFFDKCFQLRINVPSMILSGWENFCKRCIEFALQEWPDQYKEQVLNVLKNTRESVTDAPSPRQIKTYVNQVGFLAQSADENISIEAISYYVILKYLKFKSINDFEVGILSGTIPIKDHQDIFSKSIVSELCGLLYGVPAAKGVQILIEPEIEESLTFNSKETIIRLLTLHPIAFWTVLNLHLQKINEQNKLFKYSRAIWESVYNEHKNNFAGFRKKLISLTTNIKSVNFPENDSDLKEISSFMSILENDEASIEIIWRLLLTSFQGKMKEMKIDLLPLSNNFSSLLSITTGYKLPTTLFDDIPIESWLNWVAIDKNNSQYKIKPSNQIVKGIVTKLEPKTAVDTNLWSLIRFVRKQGILNLNEIEQAVLSNIKVNGASPNPAITNVSFFKIIADLAFWGSKELVSIFSTYEIYNLSASVGMPSYLGIAMGKAIEYKMFEIKISHNGNSNAGYQQVITFWKTANQDNALFVWGYAKYYNDYIFIWNMATDSSRLLVKDILKIGISERNKSLFEAKDGLDSLNRCLYHFDKDSEEIKAVCSLLIEYSDIENVIADAEDISDSLNELLVILKHAKTEKIQLLLEKKFLEISRVKWLDALTNDSIMIDILETLVANSESFKLKNDYLDAIIDFLNVAILDSNKLCKRYKEDIEKIFKPLSNEFISHASRLIGKQIAINNYKIDNTSYKLLIDYISFSDLLKTHHENFENALDSLSNNGSMDLVDILCRVIEDNKSSKYKLPEQYPVVLVEPLMKLSETADEVSKNKIRYLMDFLKIKVKDEEIKDEA